MNEFRKPFGNDHKRRFVSSGSRFANKMSLVHSDKGGKHLEKVGETDIYALIQSYKDSCDLNLILERCMRSGDYSLLNRVQSAFMDISGFSPDARVAQDIVKHSRFVYESLTPKQKAMYPTFDDFMDAFSTKENIENFISVMGIKVSNVQAADVQAAEGGKVDES